MASRNSTQPKLGDKLKISAPKSAVTFLIVLDKTENGNFTPTEVDPTPAIS